MSENVFLIQSPWTYNISNELLRAHPTPDGSHPIPPWPLSCGYHHAVDSDYNTTQSISVQPPSSIPLLISVSSRSISKILQRAMVLILLSRTIRSTQCDWLISPPPTRNDTSSFPCYSHIYTQRWQGIRYKFSLCAAQFLHACVKSHHDFKLYVSRLERYLFDLILEFSYVIFNFHPFFLLFASHSLCFVHQLVFFSLLWINLCLNLCLNVPHRCGNRGSLPSIHSTPTHFTCLSYSALIGASLDILCRSIMYEVKAK